MAAHGPHDGPIRIFLVEDNLGDIRLLEETLKEYTAPTELHVVRDGVDALAFLRKTGPFQGAPDPDLILLDLSLPRLDGRRVLAEVRSDPRLNVIPVVIYTNAKSEDDAQLGSNFRADGFVTKPLTAPTLAALVRKIGLDREVPRPA